MPSQRNRPVGLAPAAARRFIDAFATDLESNCATVIAAIREEKPYDYFRIAVSLLPKELPIENTNLEEMSDEEIAVVLNTIRPLIAARLAMAPAEGSQAPAEGSPT